MPSQYLILNADDYGRTANISRGIRQAHTRGILTSTTCMLNFPTAAEDIQIALAETPNLSLGVHLVLTAGQPLSPTTHVPSLVQASGQFWSLSEFTARRAELKPDEVRHEWRAQIEAFRAAAGQLPTHLDSHHHTSYATPALFRVMLELAQEYQCAIRLPHSDENADEKIQALLAEFAPRAPDGFIVSFYAEGATLEHLLALLAQPRAGVYEIMCHPGYSDAELAHASSYAAERERELTVLTDPTVRAAVTQYGWELVSFAALKR